MHNSLDNYIKKLPTEIGREIFSFIIPRSLDIIFNNYIKYIKDIKEIDEETPLLYYTGYAYNKKYEIAYLGNILLKNKDELYLSRISKKNGKYRYYITKEIFDCREDEDSNGRICDYFYYRYISKYIGNDIDYSLILLYSNITIFPDL